MKTFGKGLIIFIFFIILLVSTLMFTANLPLPNTNENNFGVENKAEVFVSDTILVNNDSLPDKLKVKYGLQVMDYSYRRVGLTETRGYSMDFSIKIKNLRNKPLNGKLELNYKVIDPKTNEVVKSDYSFLRFNNILPNEIIQLEPYLSWTYRTGKKYILYLWIEDIPMKPIDVIF